MAFEAIKRYPFLWAVIGVFFNLGGVLPFAIFNVWDAFSDDKVPVWLARRGWTLTWAILVWLGGAFVATILLVIVLYLLSRFCFRPPFTLSQSQLIDHAKTGTIQKRDWLVKRLTGFVEEAERSWESSGRMFRDFAVQTRSIEVGLSLKIEKFLEIHLPNEIDRFKKKGIDGVEEIIGDLLDGGSISAHGAAALPTTESLAQLEEQYEIKKLEPHFVDMGSEPLKSAHNDENGVIITGSKPNIESFLVFSRLFENRHPAKKVRSVKRVSFRLNFICFDPETRSKPQSINIHRGAWLNQARVEVDFPDHCPPQRAIIVTAEGDDNRVYAVRRDSDTYKGILPLREPLTGRVYTVFLTLLVESRNSKSFQYILEIIREPKFDLRLTDAVFWKAHHLHAFVNAGFAFLDQILAIGEGARKQFPAPPPKLSPKGSGRQCSKMRSQGSL